MSRAWLWLLSQFDMVDGQGKPQYSKLVITAVLVAAIVQSRLTTAIAIAVIAAAFGRSVFIAFLCRTQIAVADETKRVDVSISHEIVERRENGDYEETP